eukprot:PhF_6_TR15539/c0_g1_i1/m.24157
MVPYQTSLFCVAAVLWIDHGTKYQNNVEVSFQMDFQSNCVTTVVTTFVTGLWEVTMFRRQPSFFLYFVYALLQVSLPHINAFISVIISGVDLTRTSLACTVFKTCLVVTTKDISVTRSTLGTCLSLVYIG